MHVCHEGPLHPRSIGAGWVSRFVNGFGGWGYISCVSRVMGLIKLYARVTDYRTPALVVRLDQLSEFLG